MLYKKKEIYTNLENQNDIITKKKEIIEDNKAHVIIIINILAVNPFISRLLSSCVCCSHTPKENINLKPQ